MDLEGVEAPTYANLKADFGLSVSIGMHIPDPTSSNQASACASGCVLCVSQEGVRVRLHRARPL
eukprot:3225384-Rhodomonas_salina.1